MGGHGRHGLIVVGLDGSDESLAALDWAADDAQRRGVPVRIVHALLFPTVGAYRGPTDGDQVNEARELLRAAGARARLRAPDISVSTELTDTAPAITLIEESAAATAVVVGGRGRGGFAGLLVGSVGRQLAEHARCPVVVVRGRAEASGAVVVGVDPSPGDAEPALELAFEEAGLRGTRLLAVRAWQEPPWTGPTDALLAFSDVAASGTEHERLLAETLAPWQKRFPEVPVELRVIAQAPAEALVHATRGAALLVVGARGLGGFAGLVLGSVSNAAIQHAACPVVVVRQ